MFTKDLIVLARVLRQPMVARASGEEVLTHRMSGGQVSGWGSMTGKS